MGSRSTVMEDLVRYVSNARSRSLPDDIMSRTKHHVLDTVAAMISGATIRPGQVALDLARVHLGGRPDALVVGTTLLLPVVDAAMANGMLAHADETDDSNSSGNLHPGCSVIPAALAMAEREDASGAEFLRSVALGYDIGSRVNKALGGYGAGAMRARGHLPFSIGGTMGATAAAGSLAGFTRNDQYRFLFSYGAQQASGVMTYARDTDHIEKAFVFGAMPSRNGLTSAIMVQAGATGVEDVFSGPGNFLDALSDDPDPSELVAELGDRYEVTLTNIKKYCTGFPIQGPLEGVLQLRDEAGFGPHDVEKIVVRMLESGARVVDDREMPNISLQYLFAVGIIDGAVSFDAAHDVGRMADPVVASLKERISVVGDPQFPEGHYQSVVDVALKDGRSLSTRIDDFRGSVANPLTTAEVEQKARGLIEPVLGVERTESLIGAIRDLESLATIRQLRPFIAGPVS